MLFRSLDASGKFPSDGVALILEPAGATELGPDSAFPISLRQFGQARTERFISAADYRRYAIPVEHLVDFLAAMTSDLEVTGYADLAALDRYMWGSAAVIGLQVLPVLGTAPGVTREEAAPYAIALGEAFQLLVNGLLAGRGVVRYDPSVIWGVRLASAPVEDLLFGFALVTLTLASWAAVNRRANTASRRGRETRTRRSRTR